MVAGALPGDGAELDLGGKLLHRRRIADPQLIVGGAQEIFRLLAVEQSHRPASGFGIAHALLQKPGEQGRVFRSADGLGGLTEGICVPAFAAEHQPGYPQPGQSQHPCPGKQFPRRQTHGRWQGNRQVQPLFQGSFRPEKGGVQRRFSPLDEVAAEHRCGAKSQLGGLLLQKAMAVVKGIVFCDDPRCFHRITTFSKKFGKNCAQTLVFLRVLYYYNIL